LRGSRIFSSANETPAGQIAPAAVAKTRSTVRRRDQPLRDVVDVEPQQGGAGSHSKAWSNPVNLTSRPAAISVTSRGSDKRLLQGTGAVAGDRALALTVRALGPTA
jgi:hypothetical protein